MKKPNIRTGATSMDQVVPTSMRGGRRSKPRRLPKPSWWDSFLIRMPDDSMRPACDKGDGLYVSASKKPRLGRMALVVLKDDVALVRHLSKLSPASVVLSTYDPKTHKPTAPMQIERKRVRRIFRIVGWVDGDALGDTERRAEGGAR